MTFSWGTQVRGCLAKVDRWRMFSWGPVMQYKCDPTDSWRGALSIGVFVPPHYSCLLTVYLYWLTLHSIVKLSLCQWPLTIERNSPKNSWSSCGFSLLLQPPLGPVANLAVSSELNYSCWFICAVCLPRGLTCSCWFVFGVCYGTELLTRLSSPPQRTTAKQVHPPHILITLLFHYLWWVVGKRTVERLLK